MKIKMNAWEMELAAKEVGTALTQDVDNQIKNEPSRLVRATWITYKCILVLMGALLVFMYITKEVVTDEKIQAHLIKLSEQYMNATLMDQCVCDNKCPENKL
jgi:hypothetical protein